MSGIETKIIEEAFVNEYQGELLANRVEVMSVGTAPAHFTLMRAI